MILGPVIGSFSYGTSMGYLGTVIVAGTISFFALIFITKIKESLPPALRNDKELWCCWMELLLWKRIMKFRNTSGIFELFNIKVYFSFAINAFTTVIILYMIDAFGYSEKELAIILFSVGMMMIVNQLVMVKFLVSLFG